MFQLFTSWFATAAAQAGHVRLMMLEFLFGLMHKKVAGGGGSKHHSIVFSVGTKKLNKSSYFSGS